MSSFLTTSGIPATSDSTEPLISSFTTFVQSIESETRVLKSLTNIRNQITHHSKSSASQGELFEKISDLDSILSRLERSVELFEENLDSEMSHLQETRGDIYQQAKLQSQDLQLLRSSVDSSTSTETSQGSSLEQNQNIQLISTKEFEQVSKSTRNRLTLAQTNESMQFLLQYAAIKSKMLKVPRNKMTKATLKLLEDHDNMKVPEHGAAMFITESEIRSSKMFASGEATGRATLHTLRALKRLKLVRSGSESTYMVINQ